MITNLASPEIWFVTGSQHLYGPEAVKQVAANAEAIARSLSAARTIPLKVVFKPIVTRPEEVRARCLEANNDDTCAGLILWMHTFSPSKMWIGGLSALLKPFLHLHTQFSRDLPWGKIDMDFMNLHQSAHGDREAGFLHTRMRLERKVVVGHHSDPEVRDRLASWMRAARGHHDMQGMKIARIGDNMREVAVTDGDKVAAEMRFGYAVNGYGVGDVVAHVDAVSTASVT
ncbi:MAG: L-arabinose isomerase, partial [Verrucomicrobia bacterium]|nr:L-arabinose isomerase [Verrucomicrobiota bacterium]